jgi:hypothetical protein
MSGRFEGSVVAMGGRSPTPGRGPVLGKVLGRLPMSGRLPDEMPCPPPTLGRVETEGGLNDGVLGREMPPPE